METKTKSRLDFQRAETELFISYYLSQECLWNLQHSNYSKRENRVAAQSMIAKQMACHGREMTVDQVATKIASLRTYYGRELRKINASEKSGAGVDEVYTSTWEFFPLLDPFLRCHVQQRQSSSNMVKAEAASTSCEGRSGLDVEPKGDTDNPAAVEPSQEIGNASIQPKKRKVEAGGDIENVLVRSLQAMEEKNKTRTDRLNDADYLFGQQIALELKQISNDRKKQLLKLKVHQLIYEFTCENEQ